MISQLTYLIFVAIISIFGFISSLLVSSIFQKYLISIKSKNNLKNIAGVNNNENFKKFSCSGFAANVLNKIVKINYVVINTPKKYSLILRFIKKDAFKEKKKSLCYKSNLYNSISYKAFCVAQIYYASLFSIVGLLIGAIFTTFLMVILFVLGLIVGINIPGWAMKKEAEARQLIIDKSLPEMLDVVCLGLRSGLNFDKSFSLYHSHFSDTFANECAMSQKKWESALSSREEQLRLLSKTYNSQLFSNIVDSIVRSLRYGSSLVSIFEESSKESRELYKAKQEELVSKVPVKMMIPTGVLILPAMLILVLGPILLELINGF